jgi:hypothetical protein
MITGVVVDRYVSEYGAVASLFVEIAEVGKQIELDLESWQLSVPAKPAVVLPTEAGSVIGWTEDGDFLLAHIDALEGWVFSGATYSEKHIRDEIDGNEFRVYAPVAVTAKKVLDSMKAEWEQQYTFAAAYELECKRWGVTDD